MGILPISVLAALTASPLWAEWAETHTVPLFSSAGDPTLQGFVQVSHLRLMNPSDTEITVTVKGMDD